MEAIFNDKIKPIKWGWCIINNLDKFNDNPMLILDLYENFKEVKGNGVIGPLFTVFEEIVKTYKQEGRFPDIKELQTNLSAVTGVQVTNDPWSMNLYASFMKHLEKLLLVKKITKKLIDIEDPAQEDFADLSEDMRRYVDSTVQEEQFTKNDIIHCYDKYSEDFKGVKTYVSSLDEVIRCLGYQSLSVFAAPSGHGKSTLAMSIALENALRGLHVVYLSFEVPQTHVWFNFASNYSSRGPENLRIMSSKLKNSELTEEEAGMVRGYLASLLNDIKQAGGYLSVLDQTSGGIDTFENMCATIEGREEIVGAPVDLIVIDNVDNLQILRSKERDEVTKINNYIIKLDAFSKKCCNGRGAAILLLSQVNRPAMKKLTTSAKNENGGTEVKTSVKIDVTCIQKFNALYEKAQCVLIGYADEVDRSSGFMRVYPVKLRNTGVPENPIKIKVDYKYCIASKLAIDPKEETEEKYVENSATIFPAAYAAANGSTEVGECGLTEEQVNSVHKFSSGIDDIEG